MSRSKPLVSEQRKYSVTTVAQAKSIAEGWLAELGLNEPVCLGLPEVDDRYHLWRVPLCDPRQNARVGELVVDAYTATVLAGKSTKPAMLRARLLGPDEPAARVGRGRGAEYPISPLRNTIGLGDAGDLLDAMPANSIDLVFTSPPYFNARPEYSDFEEYEHYLDKMRQVIRRLHRVLVGGRFAIVNTAPVLIRRAARNQSSKRLAVPFDFHRILTEEGFDFVDDIIWVKPDGAGWATGRGRRFAADRHPLQYKAVPVTEYVLVYRKRSDLLIDWFIRNHPDRRIVAASKIGDDYERTNVWRIQPNTTSKHPAAFPEELARKVVTYYSFQGDVVLDPFAGSGTVGAAAARLGRRFVLFDSNPEYIKLMASRVEAWLGRKADNVQWLNCSVGKS